MSKKIIILSALIAVTISSITAQIGKKQLSLKDTITDRHIQVPKDLDHNLEELLIDWKKKYKKSPTYNPLNDKDITYSDSTYINRLYSLPTEMELAYNQIVRSYIDLYTSRRRSSVSYMLAKGKYYFPFIEEALDKYKLPLELKFLPVIESAINPTAVSRAGATGLWQFMLSTGRMYDLEANSLVDERRDPLKSTEAAARYLKDLYDIYGDWNLVIAAYNCGPGNVNKAIRRSGGQRDYWAIYPYLPKETRGYVPAFIAATYIMSYYQKHNIQPMEYIYPVSVDTLIVNKTIHFQQISDMLNISLDEIRDLNPQYKKDIVPGDYKKYAICLPSNIIAEFINNQDTIFQHKAQEYLTHRKVVEAEGGYSASTKGARVHKVKRGETIGGIASKYGVTTSQIMRLNNMKSSRINVGKTLIISTAPKKTAQATPEKPKEQPKDSGKAVAAVEKKTENNIAAATTEPKTQEATTDETKTDGFFSEYYKSKHIGEIDSLDADSITPALDMLGIEGIDTDSIDNAVADTEREHFEDIRTIYHKVRIGETIAQIAMRYNISVKDIQNWNKMPSKKIKIGQRLKIQLPEKQIEMLAHAATSKDNEEDTIEEPAPTPAKTEVKQPQKQATIPSQEVKPASPAKQPLKTPATYRVKKGDTLSEIAKKFGRITAKDIMNANNLTSDKLSIDQILKIPAK